MRVNKLKNHSQAYHNSKICLISFLSWLQLPTRGSDLESNSVHCLICTGDTVHNLLVNGDTSLSPQENISQLCSLLRLANHVYQKETGYLLIQVQPQNHFSKSSFFHPKFQKDSLYKRYSRRYFVCILYILVTKELSQEEFLVSNSFFKETPSNKCISNCAQWVTKHHLSSN